MRIKGNNICEVPCILPYPQPTSAPHTPTISYEKSQIPGEFTQSVGMSGEERREGDGVPAPAGTCLPTLPAPRLLKEALEALDERRLQNNSMQIS